MSRSATLEPAKQTEPTIVLSAAKELLRFYCVDKLLIFPYHMSRSGENIAISILNERGMILCQYEDEIASTLELSDYVWFTAVSR